MAAQGRRGAACRDVEGRCAPYSGAVELKAAPEPELGPTRDRVDAPLEDIEVVAGELIPAAIPERTEPEPQASARERWLKSLSVYDRRHSSEVHGARYG
jgi:hypothetical protein